MSVKSLTSTEIRYEFTEGKLEESVSRSINLHLWLDDADAHFMELVVHTNNIFQESAMILLSYRRNLPMRVLVRGE